MTIPEALKQAINEFAIVQHDIYGNAVGKILLDDDIPLVVAHFMELYAECEK